MLRLLHRGIMYLLYMVVYPGKLVHLLDLVVRDIVRGAIFSTPSDP